MTSPRIATGHQTVTAQTVMTLVGEEGASIPVATEIHYSTRDPFAVRVVFSISGAADVEWVFARDLLISGLLGPAGTGDVQLFPAADGIIFELNSPGGRARLIADSDELNSFARRMVSAVAPGSEHHFYDIDREIGLLADSHLPGSSAQR